MTKDLIDVIIEAIQDKKGRNIVVADLTPILSFYRRFCDLHRQFSCTDGEHCR